MGGRYLLHGRIRAVTLRYAAVAPVSEIAVVGHVDRVRHRTGYAVQPLNVAIDHGLGRHQANRIRMRRVQEYILGRALLNHAAGVHDYHIVGHFRDYTQIMCYQHYRGIDLILQIAQQVEYLRLNGNVQSRCRLVCDYQLGVARQCHCNHYALTHTARQLMGVHAVYAHAVGYADFFQHFDGARLYIGLAHLRIVQRYYLIQLRANAEYGVQAGHGFLEYHRYGLAANLLHGLGGHLGNVHGLVAQIETYRALDDLALRTLYQLHQRQTGNGLAATGLANHAHGLALRYLERYAVNRLHRTYVGEEVGMQVVELDHVGRIAHRGQVLGLGHVLAIALFLYLRFYLNGKSLVWSHDGVPQHLNSLAYYGRYLRKILHTLFIEHKLSIPMWDLNIGYGSDILTTLHYYVIGDPLTLLSVFFKSSQTEFLYEFLIFLRIYLAGIAFSRYAFYHKNSKQAVFMGSMIYVFAGWTIYAAMKHPYFSNPMIYLPFILMGIDKIYKKEKPYIFIWSVALAGLSNFYFFYMLGIFMVLYAAVRYFEQFEDRSLKNIGRWLGTFFVYSIIAVLIAAVILLPVILPVLGTDRFKAQNYVPLLYDKVYYEKYLGCLIGENMIQWGVAGFTAVSMTGVFVLFSKRKKYTALKVGFVLLNAFLLLPYAGHVLNGFSYVSNRWIWAYGMLIAYIFVKIYPELFTLTLKEKRKIFVMLLIYCGIALLPDAARTQRNMMAVIFLVAATFTVLSFGSFFVKKRNLTIMVSVFLIAGILFNIYYQYSYEKDYLSEFTEQGEALDKLETGTDLAVLDTEDSSLYRYDQMGTHTYENSSMQMGTNSASYYFSVAIGNISNFFDEMYLNTPREDQYDNLDSRTILDRLAAVKYFVVRAGEEEYLPYGYNKMAGEAEKKGKTYRAYECDNALPFGYTYDSYIPREKYEKMSVIEKQQALLQGVVLDESSLPETVLTLNDREVPFKIITGKGCQEKDGKLIVTKENAQARLVFDGLDESETYLITEGVNYEALSPRAMISDKKWKNMSIYEQNQVFHENSRWRYWKESQKAYIDVTGKFLNKTISIYTDKYNAYSGKHNFLCNAGYSRMGKNSLTLTFQNTGVYSYDDLKVVCQPVTKVDEQVKKLGEESLQDVKVEDHELTGKISVSKPKALVIALPYSTGFTAYVDGKKTDIKQANTMYMALNLAEGEHEIRLTYHTPYLYTGLCLTCAGLLCYIGVVLICKKKRGNKKG